MKTFTVRKLDWESATVLDACDHEGSARIKRRDGRSYTVRPENPDMRIMSLPDSPKRRKAISKNTIPAEQVRLVDKLIRGE